MALVKNEKFSTLSDLMLTILSLFRRSGTLEIYRSRDKLGIP